MTVKEAMEYTQTIIDSAKDWVNGEASIDSQEELVVIADHYNVRLPSCTKYFLYSDSPTQICATRYHKVLLKVMCKLEEKIRASESETTTPNTSVMQDSFSGAAES